MTALERMKNLTIYSPNNNCWIWNGQLTEGGYGTVWFEGATYSVHRVSAHLHLGLTDINNTNIYVLHKNECHNRACWNPDHLYLGNQSDNMKDAVNLETHRNSSKVYCHKGHSFDRWTKRRSGKIIRVCGTCAKERESKRARRVR